MLSSDQQELKNYISELSTKYVKSEWGLDVECQLYLQLSGFRFTDLFSITRTEEKKLRELGQKANGWFINRDNNIKFIELHDWLWLYHEWHAGYIWVHPEKRGPKV